MMPLGREFVTLLGKAGLGRTIIEVGSRPALGQEGLANLRTAIAHIRYVGVDLEPGPGVNVVCRGEELGKKFEPKEFELGLCFDTLEHCRFPETVVGALAFVADHLAIRVPFCAPIHLHPDDYWRMTPSLVYDILQRHRPHGFVAQDLPVIAVPQGQEYDWPHGIYGFATKDEGLRRLVVTLLQERPQKNLMVVKEW